MSIQSHVADIGVRRIYGATGLIAIRTWRISLRIKVVSVMVLGAALLTLSAVAVARTGTIPEIPAPPLAYLPGNSVPQLPKDADCVEDEHAYLYQQCVIHLADQTIYLNYDLSTRMIVHTGISVREYKIGDLITVWGCPTGMSQSNTLIIVYWGRRSAVLYADSFRPESPVEFIQYDMQEHQASAWQGFRNIKSNTIKAFGNS